MTGVAPRRSTVPAEMERPDDDLLMERYAQGDAEAFQQIYDHYERRIYSFCLRFLGDSDAADDAFQDVFMRVVDASDSYEGRGRFASWLFTVARRVCLDRVRAMRPTESLDDQATPPNIRDVAEQVAYRDELQRLLDSLPRDHREILILNRYHGFTYGEIAEVTATSEAAVKQKAYRALESLRSTRRKEAGGSHQ